MKLATKKDIEAPIAQVWAALSDHEAWERSAMRRGVEVERTDALTRPGPGMSWRARFAFRGRQRKAEMLLTDLNGPGLMGLQAQSDAVEVVSRFELIEMSARRTRIHVTVELKPRSLGARLFLQSLRLARSKVDRKFDSRITLLAQDLEMRAKAIKTA
jgi:uncharacterized protein YndB with AHSA1/START domain